MKVGKKETCRRNGGRSEGELCYVLCYIMKQEEV